MAAVPTTIKETIKNIEDMNCTLEGTYPLMEARDNLYELAKYIELITGQLNKAFDDLNKNNLQLVKLNNSLSLNARLTEKLNSEKYFIVNNQKFNCDDLYVYQNGLRTRKICCYEKLKPPAVPSTHTLGKNVIVCEFDSETFGYDLTAAKKDDTFEYIIKWL